MTKTVLLDAAGNPIGAPKPKPVILDAKGEWLDGDNDGELVLKRTQEVPDEFWEENARRREQSRINGPGWMMSAVRMPEIIQEKLFRTYPHLSPKNWTTAKDITYAREMVRCLKLMGEDRCITTVWSF
jgi:hypothetical protein